MKPGSILKNVALLGGAKGISQAMIVAATPLLTRLYSPEDLGTFAVFGVLIGVLGGLSCMKYENALPLARDEGEAANIFVLCGLILSVFLFAVCVVLLVVHDDLTDWLKSSALQPYLWLLPIGVFGVGIVQAGQYWAIRIKNFKRVAAAGVATSVVVLVVQIGLGIMRLGPAGLIFGRIGGLACNSLVMLYPPLRDIRSLLRHVSRQSLTEVAKKHRQFPFFSTLSFVVGNLGRELPVIMLSIFFGPAVTGFYALARRVLNVPMILIGEQVRSVYYPYAGELERVEDIRQLTKNIFVSLVQIALPGVLIIALVAPELFALVFGERWKDSGTYAQWFCPWLFMSFVCAPLTRLPLIMERQKGDFIFHVVLLVVRGAALIAGGAAQDVTLAIGLFAVVTLLWFFVFMAWTANLVGIGMFEVFSVLGIEFLVACPIVAPLVLAKLFFLGPDDGLWLLAIGAGCTLIAAGVLLARQRHIISLIFNSKAS